MLFSMIATSQSSDRLSKEKLHQFCKDVLSEDPTEKEDDLPFAQQIDLKSTWICQQISETVSDDVEAIEFRNAIKQSIPNISSLM